ncbi:MAG: hypothetical protein H6P94_505 [Thermoplasmatales archaeon]|jgi:hypothetical protein|nr:hypothetical protein [Thermoplasmatales archaeon]
MTFCIVKKEATIYLPKKFFFLNTFIYYLSINKYSSGDPYEEDT